MTRSTRSMRVLGLSISALLVLSACSSTASSPSPAATVAASVAPTTAASSAPPASPSPAAELTGKLRFFGYTDAFDPQLLDPFKQAHPKLTIETSAIASDTEAVAKLKSGFVADMINTCAGPIDQEIANGSLQAIDTSRIEAWDTIYPFFKDVPGVNVDGKTYMIPMVGGAYGIIYRPSVITTPPTSWNDLLTSDKRITLPDDPLTSIITAALALGFDPPQDMTADQLAQVKAALIAQKKHVITYFQGAALTDLWANNEVDITASDITLVNQVADKGGDAAFAPMEPPLAWTCGYSIGAKAENLDAVYALLNHYATPAIQGIQATAYSYLVSNKATADSLPADVLDKSGQANVATYRNAATFGLPANFDAWTAAWQDVKAN
jgi:spermidine/putrescine transport system substrate-binding protein